jgi:hypothetical protein
LWEASEFADGAGAFTLTRINSQGDREQPQRTLPEFKIVAVDIFGQRTPEEEKLNRENWRSLADLKADLGDPFGDGSDVEIFFMTKSRS